jgi:SAM-dependent methyltransferase
MKILDMTAGGRNIWFDKAYRDAVYVDRRAEVKPDIVADSTMLPVETGEDFDLVVFDPPHVNFSANSNWGRLYGSHTLADIRLFIAGAAREAHRVCRVDALMAFKWCNHDMRHERALEILAPFWEPLFGHQVSIRSKHASTTQWVMLRRRTLSEIESFNQLFAEAKSAGIKLFSFHQLDNGDFVARWRRGPDEVFEAVRHERPFDAARDAYLLALKPGAAAEDLFG